ncbi:MAG: phospholipase D-like domain-containing protein [Acidobacteriota bacterium]|nr:phospholipase D-like domain-containing protein [Acidobacteriota bacterium]
MGLFGAVKPLLILGFSAVAIVSLFRESLTHALNTVPVINDVRAAAAGPLLRFSPDENLERLDEQQLRQAHSRVDISMYAFTDRALAESLREIAGRGVAVRIYRDQEQFRNEQSFSRSRGFSTSALLRGVVNIQIRVKRGSARDLMHQKDYCVDGKVLRDGSANWSPGAEKAQDNSLWFTSDAAQIVAYERKFDEMWNRTSNLVVQ